MRRYNGLELPDDGRSSQEDVPTLGIRLGRALSQFGGLQPEISFQYLELLKQLWIWNPLMSQFVENITNLGNTGHSIIVNAASATAAETALARINETATRLWPHGAGVDGLINTYFSDIAWSGALSSEDVVNFRAGRVEKVVIVPVEQIRFDWDGQDYLPYQLPKHFVALNRGTVGMIPLNTETYHYYALSTIGNSPYAKPPATAAIEDLSGTYTDGKANLKAILKKYGLLGFAAMQVTAPPRKPSETEDEYQRRAKSYLAKMRDAVSGIWQQGLLLMFKDQKLEFQSLAENSRGANEVWTLIENQIFNGFGQQPAFFGRVNSTTETFADVTYSMLDGQVSNFRRLPKRRMERTFSLDLMLGGVPFDGISVKFNKTPSRNVLQEAQAEQVKTQTAIEKAKAGLISPDDAAQELGYDSAFDSELLSSLPQVAEQLRSLSLSRAEGRRSFSATFQFDRSAQRYRFTASVIELASVSVELAQKKKPLTEEEINRILDGWINKYLGAVGTVAETALKVALEQLRTWLQSVRLSEFERAEGFADQFFEQLDATYKSEWSSSQAQRIVRQAASEIYQYYRVLNDAALFAGQNPGIRVRFGGIDRQTSAFFGSLDNFYFSRYLNNSDKRIKQFLADEYIAKGGRSAFDMTPEQIEDIRQGMGALLKNVNDVAVERIVSASVARARNWGEVRRLNEARIELAQIVAVLDSRTSELCKFLNGKFIPVKESSDVIDRLVELQPGEFAKEMYESPEAKALRAANENPDEVRKFFEGKISEAGVIDKSFVATGRSSPPYHVSCRSRLEAVVLQ